MSDQFYNGSQQPAPFSQEAEEAVLGALLTNPNVYFSVASFLKGDDFFLLRHQWIWQAIERITARNEEYDYLTVGKELQDTGHIEEIGGIAYLLQLVNNTPSSAMAEVYGKLVQRAATRRRLLTAAEEIKELALDEELSIERVTDEAENRMFAVTESQVKKDLIPMRDAINEYFGRIEHLMVNQDQALGLPTGFRSLDTLLGGLQRSDLMIFAGRPGMGKTSFMLSVALNIARYDRRIAIFTMEMGVEQIVQRFVSMETGINMQRLRLGQVDNQEWSRLVEAMGRLSSLKIFIDDTPALTPLQMRTKCRRMAREHGIDLIIVDYLQLMNAGTLYENNRVQEISYISRSLKEIARELNVPLFSAAQLSRAVEQRADKRPQLSDLRESGCLTGDSPVYLPDEGRYVPIADLCGQSGFNVLSLNTTTYKLESAEVSNAFCTGVKPVYRLTTQLGRSIRATANHKFLTIHGWKRLDELTEDDRIALPRTEVSVPAESFATEMADNDNGQVNLKSEAVNYLATSDVYWDKIASIVADSEEEVYDLTVPQNSNFVVGNIVAHNSIEQDADIVMFLYRDEVYNEATEYPNQADVIVAKHRNGPTDTISLYFDKTITRFLDARAQSIDLSRG